MVYLELKLLVERNEVLVVSSLDADICLLDESLCG